MYEENSRYAKDNGYVLVYNPTHPRAMSSGSFAGYVYEHVLMAEEILDRPLRADEVVHHLDFNKSNNSPDNILVLSGPMHGKLHRWLDKYTLTPSAKQLVRLARGCVRCTVCQNPIHPNCTYCSMECQLIATKTPNRPSPEELVNELLKKSFVEIGRTYGVSDNAVRKWCRNYGLPDNRADVMAMRNS